MLEFRGQGAFIGGLVLNLLAHVCYTAAFLGEVRDLRLLRALPFFVWVGGL